MVAETQVKRAAIYCRVSTDEQAEHGYSLADQQERGSASIASRGRNWAPVEEPYIDDGVSGTLRHRPALDRLLADAKAGKINVVVCTKLDRLARKLKVLLSIWDELEELGVAVVVIEESIDTTTPIGRLVRNVLGAIAEFEVDTIAARTKIGRLAKVREGEAFRSRNAMPYGLRYIVREERAAYDAAVGHGEAFPHTNGWVIVEPEAIVVRRIFTEVAAGKSMQAVAMDLVRDGVPTPRGGSTWTNTTIHNIIHNPAMWGKPAYGRTQRTTLPEGQNRVSKTRTTRRPAEEVLHGEAPAIVTHAHALAAQAAASRNKSYSRRNSKHDYLLASSREFPLLVCGECATEGSTRRMGGIAMSSQKTGKPYLCYRCSHTKQDGHKKYHIVPAEQAERAVWSTLCRVLRAPETMLAEIEALAETDSARAQERVADVRRLEATLAEIDAKQRALLDYVGLWKREQIEEKYAGLAQQEQELRARLAALRAEQDAAEAGTIPVEDIKAACARIADGLDKTTFEERQQIVRLLLTRVTATRTHYVVEGVLPIPASLAAEDGADGATSTYKTGFVSMDLGSDRSRW